MAIKLFSSLAALGIVFGVALPTHAQEAPLPSTTDCGFSQSDACMARYFDSLQARARTQANERYRRGFRALGGLSLAFGAPQFVGGIVSATQAPRDTNNVGHSVAWTFNGLMMSAVGAVFVLAPLHRTNREPEGGAAWIPTVVLGTMSASYAAWAAATWIAPPQDVSPVMRHLFAASMVVDALWYATFAIISRVDWREPRSLAGGGVMPYAFADGRSSVAGLAGRF
jgi:hypothetical protein